MVWSSVSQVFCPMESAVVLTRGRYCHPALKSGTHRAAEASGDAFFGQPYRWPTTVPTNQAREAALGIIYLHPLFIMLLKSMFQCGHL